MTLTSSQLEQIRHAMEAVRLGAALPVDIDRLVDNLVAEVERLRAYDRLMNLGRMSAEDVDRLVAENAAMREILREHGISPEHGK